MNDRAEPQPFRRMFRLPTTAEILRCYRLVASFEPGSTCRQERKRTLLDQIIAEVCEKYMVRKIDVISDRRTRELTIPRQEIMWRAKQETRLSLPQIGRKINRDHSTVKHGIRRHQARVDATRAMN